MKTMLTILTMLAFASASSAQVVPDSLLRNDLPLGSVRVVEKPDAWGGYGVFIRREIYDLCDHRPHVKWWRRATRPNVAEAVWRTSVQRDCVKARSSSLSRRLRGDDHA